MFLIICTIRSSCELSYLIYVHSFHFTEDYLDEEDDWIKILETIRYFCDFSYFLLMISEPFVWYKVIEFFDEMMEKCCFKRGPYPNKLDPNKKLKKNFKF